MEGEHHLLHRKLKIGNPSFKASVSKLWIWNLEENQDLWLPPALHGTLCIQYPSNTNLVRTFGAMPCVLCNSIEMPHYSLEALQNSTVTWYPFFITHQLHNICCTAAGLDPMLFSNSIGTTPWFDPVPWRKPNQRDITHSATDTSSTTSPLRKSELFEIVPKGTCRLHGYIQLSLKKFQVKTQKYTRHDS